MSQWTKLFPPTLPKQQFKPGDKLAIRQDARTLWIANTGSDTGPWEALEVMEANFWGYDVWSLKGYPDTISEQWLEKV